MSVVARLVDHNEDRALYEVYFEAGERLVCALLVPVDLSADIVTVDGEVPENITALGLARRAQKTFSERGFWLFNVALQA